MWNRARIVWIGTKASNRGKSEVRIDGSLVATVDLYNATTQNQQVLFSTSGLGSGSHTIEIRATSTNTPPSTGYYTDVDAFEAEGV